MLIGVTYLFPAYYTGMMQPRVWSRLVGTGTYNVKDYIMDVTPFVHMFNEVHGAVKSQGQSAKIR